MDTRSAIGSYLLYLGVSSPEAQEVTQEVYLRLYQCRRRGQVIENLRGWLFRVAHNLGLQARTQARAFPSANPDWDRFAQTDTASAEKALIDRERRARVADALDTLSPQQRHCLYLRSEGLRYREIAQVIGISPSSVNEFLRRAISRLSEAANG